MKVKFSLIATLRLLLIFVLVGICFYFFESSTSNSKNVINKMPDGDKKILENFFREMQTRDSMAYVVLGTKPIMWTDFDQSHLEDKNYPHNEILQKGWVTWKKYEKQFPHSNFIFRIFGDLEHDEIIDIILINKKNLKKEFEKYPQEYALLTQNSSLENWLQTFEGPLSNFNECFHQSHVLKGIAFGFGKHNALTFQKNWDIFCELREKYPNEGPDFIDEELEKSDRRIFVRGFIDSNLEAKKHMILPRCAMVPDHEETLELQKRYENDREKIIETLSKKGFLEAILEALTSRD